MASLLEDVTGTLNVSAASPVAVMALRFRGSNFSSVPVANLSGAVPVPEIATGVGGPGAVILSQFAAGGGFATEIVVMNAGPTPLVVRVDLFSQDGGALTTRLNGQSGNSFRNLLIPPNGVVTLAPWDSNGNTRF